MSLDEGSWFVSVTPVAMVAGLLFSIPASDMLGRKRLFLVSNSVSMFGYLVLYFAPSFLFLMIGRAVQCTGMALGAQTTGVFLNEISTVKLRGPLSGCNMSGSNVIGLLWYTAVCIFLPINWLALTLAANNLLAIFLLMFLPESPQWLVCHDRADEAKKSLRRLRGQNYPGLEVEVEEIKQCIMARESLGKAPFLEAICARTFSRPMLMFTVVFVCIALCGQDTLVFYGPTIFTQINIGISSAQLATLPWLGFTIGYATSSPFMARYDLCDMAKDKDMHIYMTLTCFRQKCFQDESSDTVCQLHLHHVNFNDLSCCHAASSGPGDRVSCCCPGYFSSSNLLPSVLAIMKLKRWAW